MVFAIDRAGIVGDDGKTHQGAFDISYLRSIPNIIVSAPRNEDEFQNLLYTAVDAGQPMAIRYPRGHGEGVPLLPPSPLPIGKAEILREGEDMAIIAIGSAVYPALDAAERLSAEGISCAVADARYAKPLDLALIRELASRKRILTVEENALAGGFGAGVLEALSDARLSDLKMERLGLPDVFVEHGTQELLRSMFDLDAEGIARHVKSAFPELLVKEGI